MNDYEFDSDPDTWQSLQASKTLVLQQMAGSRNDNAKLSALTDWLRRELDLEAKYKSLLNQAAGLVAEQQSPSATSGRQESPVAEPAQGDETGQMSGREMANAFRQAYLTRQKENGNHFVKIGRIYYRARQGAIVGITASAEEKRTNESTWFLNLKEGEFHEAVLLCQTAPLAARPIHLPKAFIDTHSKRFSRDEKGKVKFNVARRNDRFWVHIPGDVGWVDVQQFVEEEVRAAAPPEYL